MKRYLERFIALVIIVTLSTLGTLAPVQPAAAFTIGEEREVGEKLLYTVRSAFDLVDDPDVTQYINNLGREALKVTGIQYFDYRFFVINDNEFNAFAAPSGLIFFYAGLISMMNSEDELVSVMAHEIGHISKRHLASRMEKGKIVGIASIGMALGHAPRHAPLADAKVHQRLVGASTLVVWLIDGLGVTMPIITTDLGTHATSTAG